jgi:hypothetical protein
MSIKDLFNKDYVSKIVSAKNLDSFAEDAESAGNVVISRKLATDFVPPIDFLLLQILRYMAQLKNIIQMQ